LSTTVLTSLLDHQGVLGKIDMVQCSSRSIELNQQLTSSNLALPIS